MSNSVNRPSVLLFDDDPDILQHMETLLDELGHDILPVSRQAEFNAALDQDPDVLILDLMLGGMDGIDMIEDLARKAIQQPILLISSCNRRVLRSVVAMGQMNGLNMVGFMKKPFSAADLANHMSAMSMSELPPIGRKELLEMIGDGRLVPFYQPQVDLQDNQVTRLEALARLRHHKHGELSGHTVMALARRTRTMDELTENFIDQVLADMVKLREADTNIPVSVNLPTALVSADGFGRAFAMRCRRAGIPPSQMAIEIRESDLVMKPMSLMKTLVRFSIQGGQVLIDNHQGSLSSLNDELRFPVSEIKVAREICQLAVESDPIRERLERLADHCLEFGIRMAVVGVENAGQLGLFKAMGVARVQGNLIGTPKPFQGIELWLKQVPMLLKQAGIEGVKPISESH